MRLARANLLELAGALVVMAIGGFAIWEGARHPVGELTHMGPGYFPILLGVVLVGLGVALLFQAAPAEGTVAALRPRAALAIFGGVAAFAVLVSRVGVVPATFALVFVSALAGTRFRPFATLLLAAGLSAIAVVVFIYGLGLPLRAFRWR